MDEREILSKLNWFYSLELNQVDLYHSQSKAFQGSYHSRVFERIAYIEQQHADDIGAKIKELGGKPSPLRDLIAPILGSIEGILLPIAGLENTLKVNILLEQKAMQDYDNLIKSIELKQNQDLLNLLKDNYVDEDLHMVWFRDYLEKLDGED